MSIFDRLLMQQYTDSKLGGIKRFELVTEEPENPEEGVVYFIAKSDPLADVWFRFDAMELALSNNDKVSEWEDLSGNGFNVVQADSAKQPTYLVAGLNGKPTVQFNSTELENSDFTLDRNIGGTIFVVGQMGSVASSQSLLGYGHVSSGPVESRRFTLKFSGSEQGIKTQINGQEALGTAPIDTAPFLYASAYDGTANKVFKNGNFVTEVSYSDVIGSRTNLVLGRSLQTNRLEPVNAKISEVIYFSRGLSDDEINTISTSLMDKWGF